MFFRHAPVNLLISRRNFLAATGSAIFSSTGISPAMGAAAQDRVQPLNVRDMGAAGDGMNDDTGAFHAALKAAPSVYVPRGLYLVDRIVVPSNRTLVTDGLATIFQQRSGIHEEVRLINILGSNVHIEDCTVRGNIASDTGEQRHGIFVYATERTGDLSNISIGDVQGINLRGDVICVGAEHGSVCEDVRIGAVHGSNILRNVVTVAGGRRISIGPITGVKIGYTHLDIEPDDYNGPVIGCAVEAVHGGFVQVAGQTSKAFVDRVRIGLLELVGPVSRSAPVYQPGLSRKNALVIRNVRSLDVGRFVARGFEGQAIVQVWDPGALTEQSIHIGVAEIRDCARGRDAVKAYILGDKRATKLHIDLLMVDVPSGVDVVRDCKEGRIRVVRGRLSKGSRLVAQTDDITEDLLYLLTGGAAVYGATKLVRRRNG